MPKLIDLVQGSPEWLKWREWKIGASDAAVIMGISPFKTALQLWEEKVMEVESKTTYAMDRGTRLEKTSRDLLNQTLNNGLKYSPACIEHDDIPWMIASLDGAMINTMFGASSGKCDVLKACEIKCPGKEAHSMALEGKVPPYYMPQLQHQMVVGELREILYVSFDGERNVGIFVDRDDDYITKKLMPALASFYQSLVDFKPPEPTDKDVIEIVDSRACIMAEQYKEISLTIEQLKEQQESLKEELCAYATHGRCKIGDLRVTKVMRKGAIDYQSIPELKSVSIEKYRKEPVISWRIS